MLFEGKEGHDDAVEEALVWGVNAWQILSTLLLFSCPLGHSFLT